MNDDNKGQYATICHIEQVEIVYTRQTALLVIRIESAVTFLICWDNEFLLSDIIFITISNRPQYCIISYIDQWLQVKSSTQVY